MKLYAPILWCILQIISAKLLSQTVQEPAFPENSQVTIDWSNSQQIKNLNLICRVWGFLKYYHPLVRQGKFDWDHELFTIINKTQSLTDYDRDSVLYHWVTGLGEIDSLPSEKPTHDNCKMSAPLLWLDTSHIWGRLSQELHKISQLKKSDSSYYVQLSNYSIPSFPNEKVYPNLRLPEQGYTLLALFRYWNLIKYYYPYRYNLEQSWDSALNAQIFVFASIKTSGDYQIALLKLIALLNDSHATLHGTDQDLEILKGEKRLPVEVEFVENHPVVVGYYSCASCDSSFDYQFKAGDQILSINGMPVDSVISQLSILSPGSNPGSKMRNVALDLLRTNDSILSVSIRRKQETLLISSRTFPHYFFDVYQRYHQIDTCFKVLNGEVGYLNPWYLKDDHIPTIMNEVPNLKGLIIDFRYPPLGLTTKIAEYLFNREYTIAQLTCSSLKRPGEFCFCHPFTFGANNSNKIETKLVLLMNEYSQSSMEFNILAFKQYDNVLLIGSTTAGTNGNIASILLPGNLTTVFTSIGVYNPDGTETQLIGLKPDIVVKKTINGVRQGADEVLLRAVAEIEK